jgi:hypothetical protein
MEQEKRSEFQVPTSSLAEGYFLILILHPPEPGALSAAGQGTGGLAAVAGRAGAGWQAAGVRGRCRSFRR